MFNPAALAQFQAFMAWQAANSSADASMAAPAASAPLASPSAPPASAQAPSAPTTSQEGDVPTPFLRLLHLRPFVYIKARCIPDPSLLPAPIPLLLIHRAHAD